MQAMEQRIQNLQKISAERIRVEMTKLLISPNPGRFRVAYTSGMTGVFLPEFDRMMTCDQKNHHHCYTVGEHCMHSVEVMQKFMAGMLPEPLSPYAAERISQICGSLSKKQYTMLVLAMLLHDVAKPDKLQPQSKQQENNADVRPSLYVCRIHHRRGISHVRTGQEACNDIPQD